MNDERVVDAIEHVLESVTKGTVSPSAAMLAFKLCSQQKGVTEIQFNMYKMATLAILAKHGQRALSAAIALEQKLDALTLEQFMDWPAVAALVSRELGNEGDIRH